MVAQLIRLKARVTWNTMTRQASTTIAVVLGLVWGLGMLAALVASAAAGAATGNGDAVGALLVVAGAALVAGWVIVPVLFASIDNTLDPRKFAPYLPASPRLALALVVATGVGVAGALSALAALVPAVVWAVSGDPLAALVAVVGAPVGLLTAFTWARVCTTWLGAHLAGSSASRDLLTVVGVILFLIVVAPMGLWMQTASTISLTPDTVAEAGRIAAWTPMGAPWGVALSAHAGSWAAACGQAVVALGGLGLGLLAWSRVLPTAMSGVARRPSAAVDRALAAGRPLVDPARDAAGHRRPEDPGALVPGNAPAPRAARAAERWFPGVERWQRLGLSAPAASLARRTQTYWLKDPRLSTSVFALLVFPAIAVVVDRMPAGPDEGAPGGLLVFFLLFQPIIMGSTIGSLMQYDSTAAWLLIASGMRGRDERLGRLAGSLPLMLAILVVSVAGTGALLGMSGREVLLLGTASVATLASASAVSLFIGAGWLYPVQPPGASPLSTKGTGQFTISGLIQLAVMAAGGVLAAPALIVLGLSAWAGTVPAAVAVPVSLVWAAAVSWAGIVLAGKMWDEQAVDDLTTIRSWPGH